MICVFFTFTQRISLDMRHIQYLAQTLPLPPLVLAFHLVLGKFHIYYYRFRGGKEEHAILDECFT